MNPPRLGAVAALPLALLAGCAALAPGGLPPGTPIAEARHAFFGPTGEYPLADGGTRLEFAQGQFGKSTYMLDFDRQGLLVSSQQVLTEINLESVPKGASVDQVRMRFGRPAWTFGVRYPEPAQIWNYRFAGGDCVAYQISISDATHQVIASNLGQDPSCDVGRDRD